MKNSKARSSILLLSTFGVYVGLVLAGAAPRLVAQSLADYNGPQKVEDLLYPQVNFDDSVVVYLQDVESFIADLRRLQIKQRLDLKAARFSVVQSTQLPCVANNHAGSYSAERLDTSLEAIRPFLSDYTKVFTDGYAFSDCLRTPRFPEHLATDSRFEVRLDGRDLRVAVSARKATPARAVELSRLLAATFRRYREDTAVSLRNEIIKATRISALNDHVSVTTRLPRADLDPLFAQSAN